MLDTVITSGSTFFIYTVAGLVAAVVALCFTDWLRESSKQQKEDNTSSPFEE